MYKSASLHTIKPRIPKALWLLPALVVLFVIAVYSLLGWQRSRTNPTDAPADQATLALPALTAGALALPSARRGQDRIDPLRQSDPLAYLRPRLPAMPWTAPAYDGATLADPPRLACVSTPNTCNCYIYGNAQVVKWRTDDDLCRIIARDGIYDPIQRQQDNSQRRDVQTVNNAPPITHAAIRPQGQTRTAPYIGDYYRSPDFRASSP